MAGVEREIGSRLRADGGADCQGELRKPMREHDRCHSLQKDVASLCRPHLPTCRCTEGEQAGWTPGCMSATQEGEIGKVLMRCPTEVSQTGAGARGPWE